LYKYNEDPRTVSKNIYECLVIATTQLLCQTVIDFPEKSPFNDTYYIILITKGFLHGIAVLPTYCIIFFLFCYASGIGVLSKNTHYKSTLHRL
jgi:hypothetical protein